MYSSRWVPRCFSGRKPPETNEIPRTPPSQLETFEPRNLSMGMSAELTARETSLTRQRRERQRTASCSRRRRAGSRWRAGVHSRLGLDSCRCWAGRHAGSSPTSTRGRPALGAISLGQSTLSAAAANRLATDCMMRSGGEGGVRTLSVVRTSRRLSHLRSSVSQDFLRKPEGERLH